MLQQSALLYADCEVKISTMGYNAVIRNSIVAE